MRINKLAILASVVCLLGPAAHAAESLGAEITAVNEETELLKAKIERARFKEELEKLNKESEASRDSRRATVLWVEGIGKSKVAMLRFGSGWEIEVRHGDRLPDGARVAEIKPNKVSIVRHGRVEWLEFDASASATAPNQAARK